jgi:hypothetical protein
MPFVQGRLRRESLSIAFESECGHCGRPLRFEVTDRLDLQVPEAANALVFVPLVNFAKLKDVSIVDSF